MLSYYTPSLAPEVGAGVTLPELTVKDRIQLHLFDYTRFADAYEAPAEVTQGAIAHAVGIRVHHVTQYIRPLMADGLVEERSSRIRRQPRRRKAYFLSAKGRLEVASLRNSLLQEEVPLRTRTGEIIRVPLSRVFHEDRRGATLSELLWELRSARCISEAAETAKPSLVDFTQEAPAVDQFYGRDRELADVLRALEAKPLVVVTGMAGVGKTTLGAKVCEAFRGKRSLFWRQVRPWDTPIDLASRLGLFLKSQGLTEFHGVLVGKGARELSALEEPLLVDLAAGSSVLVLDDAQNASHEVLMFLAVLLRALRRQGTTSALFLSRTIPTFYSRREVAVEDAVVEIPLSGLDRTSSEAILADSSADQATRDRLVDAAGGNPLFLKLLARGGSHAARAMLETYIAEEIEPGLEAAERECLQLASFFEIPVPAGGLLRERDVTTRTLIGLQRKAFLTEVGPERFVLHESLRNYFQQGLSQERRRALVAAIVPWLLEEAETCAREGRPMDAIGYLGNALVIEVDPSRRVVTLERIGDLRRIAGDFPGAMEAYRRALLEVTEPPRAAWLHQKLAAAHQAQGNLAEAEREVRAGLDLVPAKPTIEAAWLYVRRAVLASMRQDFPAVAADLERVLGWVAGLPQDPELWGTLANERGLLFLDDTNRLDPTLAKAEFENAIQAFESVPDRSRLAVVHSNLGLALIHLGRVDEAVAEFDRSLAIADATGYVPGRETALFSKAFCQLHYVGDFEAAERTYQETFRLAKKTGDRAKLIWHTKYFADLYRMQERPEEARESLAYFLAEGREMMNAETRTATLASMVRLCVECGDLEAATAYLDEAEALRGRNPSRVADHMVAWARGALLSRRGEVEDAETAFGEAARVAPPHDRGEFLIEYGRFLASIGKRAEARSVLLQACEDFAKDPRQPLERLARHALRYLGP